MGSSSDITVVQFLVRVDSICWTKSQSRKNDRSGPHQRPQIVVRPSRGTQGEPVSLADSLLASGGSPKGPACDDTHLAVAGSVRICDPSYRDHRRTFLEEVNS